MAAKRAEKGLIRGGDLDVTIVHYGGTRKTYRAKVTSTRHLFLYPPMDTPHEFRLNDGTSRTLRFWTMDIESLNHARELAEWSPPAEEKKRASYVTGKH